MNVVPAAGASRNPPWSLWWWRIKIVRFLIVGGVNTGFAYAMFASMILLRVPYPLAAFVSTVASILFNFKSYGTIVFGNPDNRLIVRFFVVYAACYAIGLAPLAWAKAHREPILLVAAICALPMAALAFTLQRAFVFRAASPSVGHRLSS